MAFDETLAARIRDALARKRGVEEKKMFGCLCFFLNGNALAGVRKDRLIARLGPEEGEAALREPHVRAFDITGKPMRNWVAVEPEGVEEDDHLKDWISWSGKSVGNIRAKYPAGAQTTRRGSCYFVAFTLVGYCARQDGGVDGLFPGRY